MPRKPKIQPFLPGRMIDRPFNVAVALTEGQVRSAVKAAGHKLNEDELRDVMSMYGCTWTHSRDGKVDFAIVWLSPACLRSGRNELVCTVVHEATHVWQNMRERYRMTGQHEPGDECEAYTMGTLVLDILRAVDEKKPRR